jgi:hypothetical protein
MLRTRRARIVLLVVSVCVIAVSLTAYLGYRLTTPSIRSTQPLKPSELKLLTEQLDVRFLAVPSRITVWFSEDSPFYKLNVRADFKKSAPGDPFEATWFNSSGQITPVQADREFYSPAPDFMVSAAKGELWQALPVLPSDRIYHQSRHATNSMSSDGWALIRTQGDTVTLYLIQNGDPDRFKGFLRDILLEGAVDIGFMIPAQDIFCVRFGQ